jgi:toxin FitB
MTRPALGPLDTSVVVDMPADLARHALSFGLHVADPIASVQREQRYRDVLATYDPVPYDAAAAHWYGAIAATVKRNGRNPRPRMGDLMIAATARSIGAAVLTRNPGDFIGLDGIVDVVTVD